ncbi:MAG: hypothetical protein ACRD6W_03170 [Nitrososphaerales archaeon]
MPTRTQEQIEFDDAYFGYTLRKMRKPMFPVHILELRERDVVPWDLTQKEAAAICKQLSEVKSNRVWKHPNGSYTASKTVATTEPARFWEVPVKPQEPIVEQEPMVALGIPKSKLQAAKDALRTLNIEARLIVLQTLAAT